MKNKGVEMMKIGDTVDIRWASGGCTKTKIIDETKAYWKVEDKRYIKGYLLFNKNTNYIRGANNWCVTRLVMIKK